MSKTLSLGPRSARPPASLLRHGAAVGLRSASAVLARLARRLRVAAPERAPRLPEVEFQAFHHDGGAPEGALYIDGELVGFVPGVTRL